MSAEDVGSGLGDVLQGAIKFNPITAPFYFAGKYVQETLDIDSATVETLVPSS